MTADHREMWLQGLLNLCLEDFSFLMLNQSFLFKVNSNQAQFLSPKNTLQWSSSCWRKKNWLRERSKARFKKLFYFKYSSVRTFYYVPPKKNYHEKHGLNVSPSDSTLIIFLKIYKSNAQNYHFAVSYSNISVTRNFIQYLSNLIVISQNLLLFAMEYASSILLFIDGFFKVAFAWKREDNLLVNFIPKY